MRDPHADSSTWVLFNFQHRSFKLLPFLKHLVRNSLRFVFKKKKMKSLAVLRFSTFEIKIRNCLWDSWLQRSTRAHSYKSQHFSNANEFPLLEIICMTVNIMRLYLVPRLIEFWRIIVKEKDLFCNKTESGVQLRWSNDSWIILSHYLTVSYNSPQCTPLETLFNRTLTTVLLLPSVLDASR